MYFVPVKKDFMPAAVITGATQGIGKAIAEKLLSEGFSIAVCARSKEDLDTVAADWRARYAGVEIFTLPADLGVRAEVSAFAAFVSDSLPVVDILVNNAGLFYPGTLAEEPENHLESLMAVNLFSAYHLTRHLLPAMKQQRSGHIFNMCSVASLQSYDNGGAYSVTKYALRGLTENLRHELANYGIRVTGIYPGATWSRSWASSGLPEERFMRAEDIAAMVWACYSLSQAADVESIVLRPLQGDI